MNKLNHMLTVLSGNFIHHIQLSFRSYGLLKFALLIFLLYRLVPTEALAITSSPVTKNESNFEESYFEGTNHKSSWEYMGTDVTQICSAILPYYEWGIRYNNDGPILRVTCNTWNSGYRVCTYPDYPTGDAEPFEWGGACWIWGTNSTWDDGCNSGYHSYYRQDANGRLNMIGGNGCGNPNGVYRRKF